SNAPILAQTQAQKIPVALGPLPPGTSNARNAASHLAFWLLLPSAGTRSWPPLRWPPPVPVANSPASTPSLRPLLMTIHHPSPAPPEIALPPTARVPRQNSRAR